MPPPWAAQQDARGSGGSDFLPPNLSSFADPVNNYAPNNANVSPTQSHDLSLSPSDPEISDNFTFSPDTKWGGSNNPDKPMADPRRLRERIDSLQSLPEEDFMKAVNSTYGRTGIFGFGLCNRRRCVLFGMTIMFVGAAVLAVVATAGRGWHWINPLSMSPPSAAAGGADNESGSSPSAAAAAAAAAAAGSEAHPLSVACRPSRDHTERRQACTDQCNNYHCCSIQVSSKDASCAVSQKDDCVLFWDLCENEMMQQQQHEEGQPASVNVKPAELYSLCSKSSLTSKDGRKECELACEEHMCCFTLSLLERDGNTCEKDPTKQCEEYKPCGNLIVEDAAEILQDVEQEEEIEDEAEHDIKELEVEKEVLEAEEDILEAEEVLEEVEEEEEVEGRAEDHRGDEGGGEAPAEHEEENQGEEGIRRRALLRSGRSIRRRRE